ncbi:hypothetical protein O6H91_05G004000 [Diphasiastrum complanatum]|uniref:Uncharacterized protein n=1 Tax=Diphasiastrum complanatum TaxID=34168 RepID=A0ACC2DK43_DIPCM|nr:hypothetical protein O6H91_05G004000 [Diphasiastrum complanatum]
MTSSQTEHLLKSETQVVNDCSNTEEIEYIKQEIIDSLIATRASYESTSEGAVQVLNRSYDLNTSKYELIYHRDHACSMASATRTRSDRKQNFVMVRSSNGYIVVACRGTFSLSDIVQDAKVAKVPVPFTRKGRAHIGFLERALSLPIDLFLNLLRAGEKLVFTGHSLGVAVTSLVTIRILEALVAVPGHQKLVSDRVSCITFGTAPFANLELADYVNSRYRQYFHNLVSKHDAVPRAHNLLPQVFFPIAKWFVDMMSETCEVQTTKAILETVTGIPVVTMAHKLEQNMQCLWPLTQLFKFIIECAAGDEEALFFGHCGYLVLLDPEAQGSKSAIYIDKMESLGHEFWIEHKSVVDVLREHGLANHSACLVNNLSAIKGLACELTTGALIQRFTGILSLLSNLSSRSVLRIPSVLCYLCSQSVLVRSDRAMLRVVGNEF